LIAVDRDGMDFVANHVILARDHNVLLANQSACLDSAAQNSFGRVQIIGSELTLAKDCQKEWPNERGN
jgi:hypothetical protein